MAKLSAHGSKVAEFERIKERSGDPGVLNRVVIAHMSDGHLLRKTGYKYLVDKTGWMPKGWQMTAWKLWKKMKPDGCVQNIYDGLERCGFVKKGN